MNQRTFVELVDGRKVLRDSPEWRNECLARRVLQLPSLPARRQWLADFEKLHGAVSAAELRKTMQALHQQHKASTT